MESIRVKFLGTGDAFGHGGRLQPCILIEYEAEKFLVDCGASAMISMHRFGVDPNTIDFILLSHLHGDHFCGLPFFILDAQLHSKRISPLIIAGPAGTQKRLNQAMELMFPGSSTVQRKFAVEVVEFEPERTWTHNSVSVTPYRVNHPSGDPALALRVECGGRIISYTGDTEWTDSLVPATQNAGLLIAEAYFFEKQIKYHLNYKTLTAHLNELQPKRTIITHMSNDMLAMLPNPDIEAAEDGMIIEI